MADMTDTEAFLKIVVIPVLGAALFLALIKIVFGSTSQQVKPRSPGHIKNNVPNLPQEVKQLSFDAKIIKEKLPTAPAEPITLDPVGPANVYSKRFVSVFALTPRSRWESIIDHYVKKHNFSREEAMRAACDDIEDHNRRFN